MQEFSKGFCAAFGVEPPKAHDPTQFIAPSQPADKIAASLVNLVRLESYTIADLFREISRLRELLSERCEPTKDQGAAIELDTIFAKCLRETSVVHELVLEATRRAYAELDRDGVVLHCNDSMRRLVKSEKPEGRPFTDWFLADSLEVREILTEKLADPKSSPKQIGAHIQNGNGSDGIPVIVEIGSIEGGHETRGYTIVEDISKAVRTRIQTFDSAEFGTIQVDRSLRVTYCNRFAAEILGGTPEHFIGSHWREFVHRDSLETVEAQRQIRNTGVSTQYSIDLVRSDGRSEAIEVIAMPDYGHDSSRIGTLVLIKSVQVARIRDELHQVIESAPSLETLFCNASQTLKKLVPHDTLVFTVYQDRGRWAWPVHIEPTPKPPWPTRWFKLPDDLSEARNESYAAGRGRIIDDFTEFYRTLPEDHALRQDPTVERLAEKEMRSTITVYIKEQEAFKAVITCYSRNLGAYTEKDLQRLLDAGCENLARMGVRLFEREEQRLVDSLGKEIQRIGRKSTFEGTKSSFLKAQREIASLTARKLSQFYQWRHVSFYRVDTFGRHAALLATYDYETGPRAYDDHDNGYIVPFGQGLVGDAAQRGEPMLMEDSESAAAEARIFRREHAETRAAVSYPIKVQNHVAWVLNIEDARRGGVSEHDVRTLDRFVERIQPILDTVFVESLLARILNGSSQSILVLTERGTIHRYNKEAENLFGLKRSSALDTPFERFLPDPRDHDVLKHRRYVKGRRVRVRDVGGLETAALMTMRVLKESFGLRVVYLTNLKRLEWKRDVKLLSGALTELATETRYPITVVESVLNALARNAPSEGTDLVRSAKSKLADLRLSFQKFAESLSSPEDVRAIGELSELPETDLVQIVDRALREVTNSTVAGEVNWVDFDRPSERVPVRAKPDRIRFVFEVILHFLRRRMAPSDRIRVQVLHTDAQVAVTLSGRVQPFEERDVNDPFGSAILEGRELAALGEPALRRIVETENLGEYERRMEEAETSFRIGLVAASPLAALSREVRDAR